MTGNKDKADMKTDVSILKTLSGPVFAEQYKTADKIPLSQAAHQLFKTEEFKAVRFFHFRSESELSGSSIAYAVKAGTGENGTLLDGYGLSGESNAGGFNCFKGKSALYDSSIAYALNTGAGEKGFTIDGYGPFGDLSFAGFMQKTEKINQ